MHFGEGGGVLDSVVSVVEEIPDKRASREKEKGVVVL